VRLDLQTFTCKGSLLAGWHYPQIGDLCKRLHTHLNQRPEILVYTDVGESADLVYKQKADL